MCVLAPRTHTHAPLACARAERYTCCALSVVARRVVYSGRVCGSRVLRSCTGTPQCSPSLTLMWAYAHPCMATHALPSQRLCAHTLAHTPVVDGQMRGPQAPVRQAPSASRNALSRHSPRTCNSSSCQGWCVITPIRCVSLRERRFPNSQHTVCDT